MDGRPVGYPPQPPQDYARNQYEMMQKREEGKRLARRGMGIGFAILGCTVVALASSDMVGMLLSRLGYFDASQSAEFSYLAPEIYYIQYALRYLFMLLLPFAVLSLCFHMRPSDVFYFESTSKRQMGLCVMMGMGASLMVNMLSALFQQTLSGFGIQPNLTEMPFSTEPLPLALYIVIIAVLPALAEEFAYRGVVMGLLRPFGNGIAVVGSAFAFGIMHGNISQIPFAFVCGLIFGFLVVKTKSMWVGVAIHFLNNLLSVIQQIVQETCVDAAFQACLYGSFLLAGVAAILGVVLLLRRDRRFFDMEKGAQGLLTTKQQFGKFVGNAGMIICLVYIAYEVISQLKFA